MVTIDNFCEIALSLPEAKEEPHFEKTSFRVRNKIFATFDSIQGKACVKLSASDQDAFGIGLPSTVYPVPNQWGKQGWTMVELDLIEEGIFIELLKSAYCQVAPPRLAGLVRTDLQ